MTNRQQPETLPPAPEQAGADAASATAPQRDGDGTATPRAQTQKRGYSTPDSSYQNYLFGNAGSDDQPAWSDSTKGRAVIRLFSRGIMGALFFTIGGRMARSQMDGYHEAHWKWDSSKPLQAIAKGIDFTLGRGIKYSIRGLAGLKHGAAQAETIAKDAVTFRQKRGFDYVDHLGKVQSEVGRSYGSEAVSFTFDFAMASIGDALTRNVIQAIDPNIRKKWLVNDAGDPASRGEKKHFVFGEAMKSMAKSSWRILSKNQGEDWAAAIPYAFQMKFQRQFLSNVLNKRFDGHKLVFDHGINGGAYKVNAQGQIVGDYQLVGALDLHARFVGYNWYTLMFREGYDAIGNAFNRWKADGFALHAPHLSKDFNPITTPIDTAAHALRYVTKSFIKANLYMNPAVVPFWVMRVSQSKWKGGHFVQEGNPQAGISATLGAKTNIGAPGGLDPYATANYAHYPTATGADRFEKGFSQSINWLGRQQYRAGVGVGNVANKLADKGMFPRSRWFDNLLTFDVRGRNEPMSAAHLRQGRSNFMHEYMDASFSYTPYMYAKAEFGLRVDDTKGDGSLGKMDKAIYQFMDDAAGFRFGKLGKDVKHIWKLGSNFEREPKAREGGIDAEVEGKVKATAAPATTIHAAGLQRAEPITFLRSVKAANAPEYHAPAAHAAANDAEYGDDKSWVQSVVGHDVNPARIHSAGATRH